MNSSHLTDRSPISGTTLKIVGMLSMLIDHVGAFLLLPWINFQLMGITSADAQSAATWQQIYYATRAIGRLAFPIFCFLIVQGAIHTRDIQRYLLRLGIFALLSEIPFDLARSQVPFDFSAQNVYFTLFLGLLTLTGMKHFKANTLIQVAIISSTCTLSYFLNTDYDIFGVLLIVVLYLFKAERLYQVLAGSFIYLGYNFYALPSFILIYFYNGQRGKFNSKLFYLFYPIHLIILAGLARYLIYP